jgi:hypothetical protein
MDQPQIKIHNITVNGVKNPGECPLSDTQLLHLHAKSWEDWQRTYRFRLDCGSYRSELKPQVRTGADTPNLHSLFKHIESNSGSEGLRQFYAEVCTATAPLCQRLQAEGLLRRVRLDLAAKRAKHFPEG